MFRVLVVFEEVGEQVTIYKFDVGATDYELLKSFHDQYINSDDISPEISEAMMKFFFDDDLRLKYTEVEDLPIFEGRIDLLVVCGTF